jgi:OOP family OmpA-OmpF porin
MALRQLPSSKISVRSGRVSVEAISDSPEQKAELEASLRRSIPTGLFTTINISAPRPVVSPFVTRFIIDENGAQFDSCVADTPAAERRIVAAATAAGIEGRVGCSVALGTPTTRWADAVVMSINAVEELGGGTVTISDVDITLVARAGSVEGNFDRIAGELENNLPEVFALEAVLPAAPTPGNEGPPQFIATLSPEGLVQLRGRVSDDLLNSTAENFARAKFGSADISMATRVVEGLPNSWPIRVLAGIEALSKLSNGSVVVEPNNVIVRGNTGAQDAGGEITRLLIDKLGSSSDFEVSVTYVEELDPIASLPTEEECLAGIMAVTEARKITFEPSSAMIAGAGAAILDDIAEILQRCSNLRIEIAGYTDSQGSEDGNQRLSQQRADAVLDGLRVRRVPVSNFRSIGYGEANPIADNETADGREANRRIEFTLTTPESTEEPTALEQIEQEAADAAAEEATE